MAQITVCDVVSCGKWATRINIGIISPIWNGTAFVEYHVERDLCEQHFEMLTGHNYKTIIGYEGKEELNDICKRSS